MKIPHRQLTSVLGYTNPESVTAFIRRNAAKIEEISGERIETELRADGVVKAHLLSEAQALAINSIRAGWGDNKNKKGSIRRFFKRFSPVAANKGSAVDPATISLFSADSKFPLDATVPSVVPVRISHYIMADAFGCSADALRQYITKRIDNGQLRGSFPTALSNVPGSDSSHFKHYLLNEKQYRALNALRTFGDQDTVSENITEYFRAADEYHKAKQTDVNASYEQVNLPLEEKEKPFTTLGQLSRLIGRNPEDLISANNSAPKGLQFNFELYNEGDETPLSEKDAFVLFSLTTDSPAGVWEDMVVAKLKLIELAGGEEHVSKIRKVIHFQLEKLKHDKNFMGSPASLTAYLAGSISMLDDNQDRVDALAAIFSREVENYIPPIMAAE